jgi:hypothetical protein
LAGIFARFARQKLHFLSIHRFVVNRGVSSNAVIFARFVETTFFNSRSPQANELPSEAELDLMANAIKRALILHRNIQPYPLLGLLHCHCEFPGFNQRYIPNVQLLDSVAFIQEGQKAHLAGPDPGERDSTAVVHTSSIQLSSLD